MPRPAKYKSQEERLQARREQLRKNTRAWRDRCKQKLAAEEANTPPRAARTKAEKLNLRHEKSQGTYDQIEQVDLYEFFGLTGPPTTWRQDDDDTDEDIVELREKSQPLWPGVFQLRLEGDDGPRFIAEDLNDFGSAPPGLDRGYSSSGSESDSIDEALIDPALLSTTDIYASNSTSSLVSSTRIPHDNANDNGYGFDTLTKHPNLFHVSNGADQQQLNYFIKCTIPQTERHSNSAFWDSTVLHALTTEPAIQNAALALAEVHWSYEVTGGFGAIWRRGKFSPTFSILGRFKAAIEGTQRLLQGGPGDFDAIQKALVACVIFVRYHGLLGDYGTYATHVRSGMALIAEYDNMPNAQRRIAADIRHVLQRCDLECSMLKQAETAPDVVSHPPRLSPVLPDLDEARSWIYAFVAWLWDETRYRVRYHERPSLPAYNKKQMLLVQLAQWTAQYERLCFEGHWSDDDPTAKRAKDILKVWAPLARIMIAYICHPYETGYDDYEDCFISIVNACAKILQEAVREAADGKTIFSLDCGLLFPLFWAAQKCRFRNLRLRAISLFRRYDVQEGCVNSHCALVITEKCMAVEESNRNALGEIPEAGRISTVQMVGKDFWDKSAIFYMGNEDMGTPELPAECKIVTLPMLDGDFVSYGECFSGTVSIDG